MDDQARQAKFESMRKQTHHKQLFLYHQELAKHCNKMIKQHAYYAKIATSDIKRQQYYMEIRKERLNKAREKIQLRREKTLNYFETIDYLHLKREQTFRYEFQRNLNLNTMAIGQETKRPIHLPMISVNNKVTG